MLDLGQDGWPDLPESVKERVELPPATRMVIDLLKQAFGNDLYIVPRIPLDALNKTIVPPRDPMVLVRKGYPNGYPTRDSRFLMEAQIEVHVFTTDPDGELKGYFISEACRTELRDAWLKGDTYFPGLGAINRIEVTGEPTRKTDWANSVGPVQYADLPSGTWRTETTYRLAYRKDTGA